MADRNRENGAVGSFQTFWGNVLLRATNTCFQRGKISAHFLSPCPKVPSHTPYTQVRKEGLQSSLFFWRSPRHSRYRFHDVWRTQEHKRPIEWLLYRRNGSFRYGWPYRKGGKSKAPYVFYFQFLRKCLGVPLRAGSNSCKFSFSRGAK